MLEELNNAPCVVGAKQVRRALAAGKAKKLFVALDADPALVRPLTDLAGERGVPVEEVPDMKALGQACAIAVKAACAALL